MGSCGSSSDGYTWFKRLFGAILVLGFIWFVLVCSTTSSSSSLSLESKSKKEVITNSHSQSQTQTQSTSNLNSLETLGREPDLNFMKRRVPNGPDPIHNRRTGSSRRPPGQS